MAGEGESPGHDAARAVGASAGGPGVRAQQSTADDWLTFSGKVIEADSVILQGSADGDINDRYNIERPLRSCWTPVFAKG